MDERLQFMQDALSDRYTMSELCARYGISRRIGYKWLERYSEEGKRGLRDRSRAGRHQAPCSDTHTANCVSMNAKMSAFDRNRTGWLS